MNKYLLLFLLLFLLGCKKQSDANTVANSSQDSLDYYFEAANNDSLPLAKRQLFTEKALDIVSLEKNDSVYMVNYFKIANRYFNMSDLESYKKTSEKIRKISIKKKDSVNLAKANSYLGDYFSTKFMSDSAYHYYFDAENIYVKLGDNVKVAKSLLSKSILQFNEKDYIGSEKSAFEAIKFLNKTHETQLMYDAYNLLGIIYNELSEFPKALEYHNNALNTIKINDPENVALMFASLHNIGLVYQNSNNDVKAVEYFNKALESNKEIFKNSQDYATLINNLGYSELKLNNYKDLPSLFYKSLKISDSLKSIPNILSGKLYISEYYLKKKDTAKANEFANQTYREAKSNKVDKYELLALKQLLSTDPENTGIYSHEYIRINDSIQLKERQNRNKLARIEFETDELVTEKKQLVEQRKTLIYLALGIILIGVFIFVIRFQIAKNRELKLVQEQQQANEEIYQLMITQQDKVEEVRQAEKKRIAQELHDGVLGKLFGTRMNLGVLNNKDGAEAKSERVVYIDELKTLEQELREISHDLNSEKTAVFNNFVLMVHNFIESQKKICKAAITLETDPKIEWGQLQNIAKINLYRILQEAFQNINKHANATTVAVKFTKISGHIVLTVHDNGVGFNYAKKKKGIGLLNMQSRIAALNGTMEIITAPEKGTLLQFEVPID